MASAPSCRNDATTSCGKDLSERVRAGRSFHLPEWMPPHHCYGRTERTAGGDGFVSFGLFAPQAVPDGASAKVLGKFKDTLAGGRADGKTPRQEWC